MGACRQFVADSFSKLPSALNTWEISPAVAAVSRSLLKRNGFTSAPREMNEVNV